MPSAFLSPEATGSTNEAKSRGWKNAASITVPKQAPRTPKRIPTANVSATEEPSSESLRAPGADHSSWLQLKRQRLSAGTREQRGTVTITCGVTGFSAPG